MATVITSECINCGACEPECPNTAIYQGGVEWDLDGTKHAAISSEIFYIVPEKCTECVGFFDHEACAAVCPVDCCVPDPQIPETETVLLQRARVLHPDKTFADDAPSRFRKDGGAATSATEASAPATAAAPPPATPPATAAPVPAPKAAPAAAAPPPVAPAESGPALPAPGEWEVPIECFRCHGTYAVQFRHFRAGVVFRCPYCDGSYVVTSWMHNHISAALHDFHLRWGQEFSEFQERRQRDLEQFEEQQRARLEALNEDLKRASLDFKPPGAPRKRAWIFG